jgi:hypothetical protein
MNMMLQTQRRRPTYPDQTIQQGNHQRKRLYDECSCLLDSIMALFFFETKDNGPLAFEWLEISLTCCVRPRRLSCGATRGSPPIPSAAGMARAGHARAAAAPGTRALCHGRHGCCCYAREIAAGRNADLEPHRGIGILVRPFPAFIVFCLFGINY